MRKLTLIIAGVVSAFISCRASADIQNGADADIKKEIVMTRYGEITLGEWGKEDGLAKLRLNNNEIKPEIKVGYGLMSVV
ncbi:MAG: hypothetical protein BWK73_43690, partial [Thiothrix lacustris]